MRSVVLMLIISFFGIFNVSYSSTQPVEEVIANTGNFAKCGEDVSIRIVAYPPFGGEAFELDEITYLKHGVDAEYTTIDAPLVLENVQRTDTGVYLIRLKWHPLSSVYPYYLWVYDGLMEKFLVVEESQSVWNHVHDFGWVYGGYPTWPWIWTIDHQWLYVTGDESLCHFYEYSSGKWYTVVPVWLPWVWDHHLQSWALWES